MKKFLLIGLAGTLAALILVSLTPPADAACVDVFINPLCTGEKKCLSNTNTLCDDKKKNDPASDCYCGILGTTPVDKPPAVKPPAGDKCPMDQIETAVGCITFNPPTAFVAWLLKFAIGLGGGIAFLLMLFGVFQIITSGGNPDRLKAGQELITSALMGLLMIIFSIFLLRLIGVQILQLPGFGS